MGDYEGIASESSFLEYHIIFFLFKSLDFVSANIIETTSLT